MAVVCAGPKAILDVPATLEYLETRGVPVVAVGQTDLPGFYARSAGIAAPDLRRRTSRGGGRRRRTQLRARPRWRRSSSACRSRRPTRCPTTSRATPWNEPIADAEAAGIHGPALTPWLLARIAES